MSLTDAKTLQSYKAGFYNLHFILYVLMLKKKKILSQERALACAISFARAIQLVADKIQASLKSFAGR